MHGGTEDRRACLVGKNIKGGKKTHDGELRDLIVCKEAVMTLQNGEKLSVLSNFLGIKVGTSAEHLSENVEISLGKTFLLQAFLDIHQSKPLKRI